MERIIIKGTVLCLALLIVAPVFAQVITPIAEINAINEEGNPTFAGLQTMDRYTIEGVALNTASAFNGKTDSGAADTSFILFLLDDTGGIEVYSGSWYNGGLAIQSDVKQGDRVQVTGLTGHYGGQTNMNDRHNPDQKFSVKVLSSGNTIPVITLENLAGATDFDWTRQTGGEYYQGRLVTIKNVKIAEGVWGADEDLTIVDALGNTLPIHLYFATNSWNQTQPEGYFNITGVFNQEDTEAPYTGGYQLWPRSVADIQPAGGVSAVGTWDVYN